MIFAALLWSTLVLHGVVDRVENGMAVVEWEGSAIGYLPVELLPPAAAEGDTVVLEVRSRARLRMRRGSLPDATLPEGLPPRRGGVHRTRVRRTQSPRGLRGLWRRSAHVHEPHQR